MCEEVKCKLSEKTHLERMLEALRDILASPKRTGTIFVDIDKGQVKVKGDIKNNY